MEKNIDSRQIDSYGQQSNFKRPQGVILDPAT